jgi:hypothetical protein
LATLLLLAYALPLLCPPPAAWAEAADASTGFWSRVFPGVPVWWVTLRLACLAAGIGVLLTVVDAPSAIRASPLRSQPDGHDVAAALWPQRLALLLAVVQLACSAFVGQFGRLGETAYLVFLLVPAGVLALGGGAGGGRRRVRRIAPKLLVLLIVPTLWLVWFEASGWRTPRAASIVDGWLEMERLHDVVAGERRVFEVGPGGAANAYMVLEGLPLFGPDRPATFGVVKMTHAFWSIVGGGVVGALAWQLIHPSAAPVAQAAYLFSPIMLSAGCNPLPLPIGAFFPGALLLLFGMVREQRSTAALALLGTVGGFSARLPPLAPPTLVVALFVLRELRQSPRLPPLVIATAIVSGLAAVLPGLPSLAMVAEQVDSFTSGSGQILAITSSLFGQSSPSVVPAALITGRAGPLDVPVGAVLAPFATARTPIRLLGDAMLDPVGAVFMALGLACCLREIMRGGTATLLVAMAATGSLTALTSSGDYVSHTRFVAALVPFALFAAIGFDVLRRSFAGQRRWAGLASVTAVAMAAGGVVLFDRVNPSILPASWLTVGLEAMGDASRDPPLVVLRHGRPETPTFLHTARIAHQLPHPPARSLSILEFERAELPRPEPSGVYLWSPSLDTDEDVTAKICGRWPEAHVFSLVDRAGSFRALAAAADGWRPAMAPERWTERSCRDAAPAPSPGRIGSADALASALGLDAAQGAATVEIIDGLKQAMFAILVRRRADGTSMMDDFAAAMRGGAAALGDFNERLDRERPPGSAESYLTHFAQAQTRAFGALRDVLSPEQVRRLAGLQVNWLWLDTGTNPFLDYARRQEADAPQAATD